MKNVEDIYPLSPMQEVMLLHAANARAVDLLLNQVCVDISGVFDVSAFRAAWEQVIRRHSALRTAFQWNGLKRPMQVVHRNVELDLAVHDATNEAEADVDRLIRKAAQRAFDLTKAPLNRLVLIRRAEGKHSLIWSSHHLIIDRWCIGTLFEELSSSYTAARGGTAPAPQYREYIEWIARQDRDGARSFWHGELAGLRRPPRLTTEVNGTPVTGSTEASVEFGRTELASARAAAARFGVTLGVLVQVAWALTVNRLTGAVDVVLGATVSGRPPGLAGIESMLGTFVNNVPVRIRLRAEATLQEMLAGVHQFQLRRSRHDYLALPELHELSALAPGDALFDCLLVWLSPSPGVSIPGLDIDIHPSGVRSGFPLTLAIAEERERLTATLRVSPRHRPIADVRSVLVTFHDRLRALVAAEPGLRLESLSGFRQAPNSADRVAANAPRMASGASDEGRHSGGREQLSPEPFEELLSGSWQEVLECGSCRLDDDFFSIGGDSLKAARLHAWVTATTRISVPLLAFFADPTIRGMARTLAGRQWPLETGICSPIRPRGELPALFCVASPEVNTLGYGILARHLARERPVFVLQAPPDADAVRRLSPRELPALAQRYVEAMREAAPSGPYLLFGMCTGAQLCVEMARHLEGRGDRIGFLGIGHTWGYYTVSRLIHLYRLQTRFEWYWQRLRTVFAPGIAEGLLELRQLLARRLTARTSKLGREGASDRAGAAVATQRLSSSATDADATAEWLNEYGPAHRQPFNPPIRTEVTVFRIGKRPYWRVRDRQLGWGKQASGVRVIDLSCNSHLHILREPHVAEIARHVEQLLQAALPAGSRQ